jgi:single-strand DNA-binding protein
MANLNKVFLIGRLTRDPESKYTPSGAAVTEFGFAVNRYYTVNGERREDTCFLDVNAWGRLGELANNYLRKGRQAFIEGHLVFSEWQTQEGQKRSKIRITADNIQFLDTANRNAGPPTRESNQFDHSGGGGPAPSPEPPFPQEGDVPSDRPQGGENEAPF